MIIEGISEYYCLQCIRGFFGIDTLYKLTFCFLFARRSDSSIIFSIITKLFSVLVHYLMN